MVQFPAEHGKVALVLRGQEGTGKGILGRAVERIMGNHALYVQHGEHLTGKFNNHLRDCVFVYADEAFYAGDRKHVGILKAVISEPSLTTERNNQNAVTTPSFLHIIMASNELWVVPASLEARRFAVFDVGTDHMQDIPYFRAIIDQLEDGGYEAFLYHMLNIDLSNFSVFDFPRTGALDHQKKLSMPTELRWWMDRLHRGYVFRSRLGLEEHFAQWIDPIATELLMEIDTSISAKSAGERHKLSLEDLGKFMGSMGGTPSRPRRGLVGEAMHDLPDRERPHQPSRRRRDQAKPARLPLGRTSLPLAKNSLPQPS